jgi:hypothetical protein
MMRILFARVSEHRKVLFRKISRSLGAVPLLLSPAFLDLVATGASLYPLVLLLLLLLLLLRMLPISVFLGVTTPALVTPVPLILMTRLVGVPLVVWRFLRTRNIFMSIAIIKNSSRGRVLRRRLGLGHALFLIVNHDNIGSVALLVRRRLARAHKDLLRRWWCCWRRRRWRWRSDLSSIMVMIVVCIVCGYRNANLMR